MATFRVATTDDLQRHYFSLVINIPAEIKEPASLSLYNTTAVDCRLYKKPHNNKKSKAILLGRERRHRAHGFVPLRGFPQACTRTALSCPFGHRFGPVQASPRMCASEPVACLA